MNKTITSFTIAGDVRSKWEAYEYVWIPMQWRIRLVPMLDNVKKTYTLYIGVNASGSLAIALEETSETFLTILGCTPFALPPATHR